MGTKLLSKLKCPLVEKTAILILWIAGVVGCGRTQGPVEEGSSGPASSSVEVARGLFTVGHYQQALEAAQQVLIATPNSLEALQIVAQVHVAESRFAEAAAVAAHMATVDTFDPVMHWLLAFDWHMRAGDDIECEKDLRSAIEARPKDVRPHRILAQWLNAQGRRFESQPHVIAIEELGGMEFNEMLSLIDLGGPFRMVDFGELIKRESVSLYDLGQTRIIYDRGKKIELTIKELDRLAASFPQSPAVAAFRGRVLSHLGDREKLAAWSADLPLGVDRHPEYWFAVGTLMTLQQRDREAVRAFGEAIRLDPTDHRSMASLAAVLIRLGESELASKAQNSRGILDQILRLANKANFEESMWIAQQLQSMVRPWESLAWYRHAFELQGQLETRRNQLESRYAKIVAWQSQGDIEMIQERRSQAILGFDIKSFPLPDMSQGKSAASQNSFEEPESSLAPLRFTDCAETIGVKTTFISGYPKDGVKFYLHQANGGGIAAFDYDLDGNCDLYFAQSGGNPRKENDSAPNQMYRNHGDDGFTEVSSLTGTDDRRFGQGVCAADINQDGFQDLLIANIGKNAVYLNQGDGTFRASHELIDDNEDRWTSSIAAGDVNGDALADVVEVNYLDDQAIFETPCDGNKQDCTPQRFRAAVSRILINRGDGSLQEWDQKEFASVRANYGLGVLVADIDGRSGNDVFVSNDGDLNHFWRSEPANSTDSSRYRIVECASVAGCSVGRLGYSQACMGIASGDFDRNGLLDLFVTNFYDEPVNLYLQNAFGFFIDEAASFGLAEYSMPVLGFGTQAADFDNDGWLDIAVLNGHLYDATSAGVPYRMVSQLFRGLRGGFKLQDAEEAGKYWERKQLGRTLASFDFNRDGRMDLVANHLDQPIAVLRNDCKASKWLQLELVGVKSERSAVGARVTIQANNKQWTAWRTGGDGYMCTNESVLHVGLGDVNTIDKVEVQWASGDKQVATKLETNQRFLIVEGEVPINKMDLPTD